jgi:hypothetical protein
MTTAPSARQGAARPSTARVRTRSNPKRQAAHKKPHVLERDFQKQIVDYARTLGFKVEHKYGQASILGSRAIDKGFPDLVLGIERFIGAVVMVIEVKGSAGRLKPEQKEWLAIFTRAGIPTFTYWPHEWPAVKALLDRVAFGEAA